LFTERLLLKSKKAFEELAKLLTKEDINTMTESSKKFREKFAFT
jgi:hypothetical protein